MDKKRILEKLGGILTDLHSQQQFLLENTDMLNPVEAALFSANASYLADYAAILEKMTAPPAQGTQGAVAVPPVLREKPDEPDEDIGSRFGYQEKETQETASNEDIESGPDSPQKPEAAQVPAGDQESYDRQDPAAGSGIAAAESQSAADSDEPFPREESIPELDEDVSQGASAPQGPSSPQEAPARQEIVGTPRDGDPGIQEETQPGKEGDGRGMSLNEQFQERKTSLYDKIASGQGQAGTDPGADKPITNLGRSIGINERYYFIKALFSDDKVAFDQAITRIDMCHSLGEALEYVNKSLSGRYGWGRKEEDSRKFYDLLKRRFI